MTTLDEYHRRQAAFAGIHRHWVTPSGTMLTATTDQLERIVAVLDESEGDLKRRAEAVALAQIAMESGDSGCEPGCRHECPACRAGLVTHLACDPRCESGDSR